MMKIEKQFMYCDIENKIAHLVFNRPPLNLFTLGVFAEFSEISEDLKGLVGRDEVRVVVLSSAVEKAFSAGDDVREGPKTSDEAVKQNEIARAALKKMSSLPVPMIAALNGYVLGGGMVLALTCDYAIAADNTKYAFPEINFGMFPNWGGNACSRSKIFNT
ncbi:Enoyl-CoA hydratase/isomerase [Desulfuromusa kysingii]|uniref:Enoyl-CoA hydratase/isomerase n=1 Tax=Desulfuromusa kysingii TaxID=37625 RepID=A0A1H4C7Q4_9BACT|nr:enoyl-CoA hydratase/isomerase family protein [Desulfuromusa kysingii]SEA56333.1 Enoyl-CoA hydratase/isomerase [Desulfuromusa kysingii]